MEEKQQLYHKEIWEKVIFNIDDFKDDDLFLGIWEDTTRFNLGARSIGLFKHNGVLTTALTTGNISETPYIQWTREPNFVYLADNPYYKKSD